MTQRIIVTSGQALEMFHHVMQHPELREFGEFETLVGDRRVHFPLREPFLTFQAIATEFELSGGEAVEIMSQTEVAFLEAFFASCLPSCPYLTDADGAEGVHAFIDAFAERTRLSYAAVEQAVTHLNNGTLHDHPMRRWIQDIEAQDAASIFRESTRRGISPGFRLSPESNGESNVVEPQQIERSDTLVDSESSRSWHGGDENNEPRREGQSLLNLLYQIAEDQAKRDGYVHRGVSCNSCNTQPLRCIRYRCANCFDYDLCEQCEAMQIHPKTHVFYKVRIPAPFPGNTRQIQPVWYPGRVLGPPQNLPRGTSNSLCQAYGMEAQEIDALWDQFKCLAATEWPEDPDELGTAIDRQTFLKCFISSTSSRLPPPNLIHERMFDYYDTDHNGLIGFMEFVSALSSLKSKNSKEGLKKVFRGYDLNGDGYVSRKDMLLMFRAWYALTKEISRDLVAGMEEDAAAELMAQRDLVVSSQPISSAFGGAIPPGENSRIGEGKRPNAHGDYIPLVDGVLGEDDGDRGDYHGVVADVRERAQFDYSSSGRVRTEEQPLDGTEQQGGDIEDQEILAEFGSSHEFSSNHITNHAHEHHNGNDHERQSLLPTAAWPDNYILPQDAENALGMPIALEDVTEAEDRSKIRSIAKLRCLKDLKAQREAVRKAAVQDRWRRREFYLVEEDGVTAPDLFEEEAHSTIECSQEPADPIEARIKAIKHITNSSSYKSFRLSIIDEIDRRRLRAHKETDSTALADLLIQLAGMDYNKQILWYHIDRLGHKKDVRGFLDWFLDHIQSTYKDLKDRPVVSNHGSSSKQAKRSRSSSKVRFEDDLTDAELETRSSTSMWSRSFPFGKRWGTVEMPLPEKDLGQEYLYQVTQEGLNELLDPIFKQREDLAMEIERTAKERAELRHILARWSTSRKLRLVEHQIGNFQSSWRQAEHVPTFPGQGPTIGEELQEFIRRSHVHFTTDYLRNVIDMWGFGMYRDSSFDHGTASTLEFDSKKYDILDANIKDFMEHLNPDYGDQSNQPDATENHSQTTPSTHLPDTDRRTPIETAVESTGYTLADLGITLADLGIHQEEPIPAAAPPEPTLPHHRPSTLSEPNTPPSNHNLQLNPSLPSATTTRHALASEKPDFKDQQFQDKLRFLAMLEAVQREDDGRGGPGRISLEEFEEIMEGPRGERLAFIGSWVHMATYWGSGL